MTIDKAIEILEEWDILSANEVDQDLRDSVALGIEALKHIQNNRLVDNHPDQTLLPGETEA